MSDIAREFKVSPQRIHQIVKDYASFSNRNLSFANFPNIRVIGGCRKCGKRAIVIHHKNRNSNNNSEENLEPLCKKCHSIEHKWVLQEQDKSVRVRQIQKKYGNFSIS